MSEPKSGRQYEYQQTLGLLPLLAGEGGDGGKGIVRVLAYAPSPTLPRAWRRKGGRRCAGANDAERSELRKTVKERCWNRP